MTQPLPPLTASEREDLVGSIRLDGVKYPVLVDRAEQIIDGHHRDDICRELELDCPRVTLDVDDETADRLRVQLNTARRQLSAKDRMKLAIELRANGRSTRQIGEQLGVSHKTIVKDLNGATGTQVPVANLPKVVVGKDGKSASARSTSTTRSGGARPGKTADSSKKSVHATFDESQRNSARNAPAGKLNLSGLRRARALRGGMIEMAALVPPERFVSQIPIEACREFTEDIAEWWIEMSKLAAKRLRSEGAGLPELANVQRPKASPTKRTAPRSRARPRGAAT